MNQPAQEPASEQHNRKHHNRLGRQFLNVFVEYDAKPEGHIGGKHHGRLGPENAFERRALARDYS